MSSIFAVVHVTLTRLISLSYFFGDLNRLFDPAYVPSDQDIMHVRVRTIGICETVFHLHDREVLVVDVGGQRSERKKWIHCFEDATSILFVANLNGYDQCLVEDMAEVGCWLEATMHCLIYPCRTKCETLWPSGNQLLIRGGSCGHQLFVHAFDNLCSMDILK